MRKAYREKALKTHPDRLGLDSSAAQRRAAEAQFHLVSVSSSYLTAMSLSVFPQIHNAYETLRDPHRRRVHVI